jgi:glyoxylase-like metal-dependent hydrolase (beta-lactamase superfamily II)
VLTHFHFDHVCGLPYLHTSRLAPQSGLQVHGSTAQTARQSSNPCAGPRSRPATSPGAIP